MAVRAQAVLLLEVILLVDYAIPRNSSSSLIRSIFLTLRRRVIEPKECGSDGLDVRSPAREAG